MPKSARQASRSARRQRDTGGGESLVTLLRDSAAYKLEYSSVNQSITGDAGKFVRTITICRVDDLLRATALAETRHFWFRGFRHFVTPLLREATKGLSDARLLDCGCGTGANLEMLGRFGRAFGFDLTVAGLAIGRKSGRTRIARASVAAAPFPNGAFDVVTMFDVLYSLEEPVEHAAVAEMYRLTR